ncbi:MAG: TetR/AcrR family transcriptional regulator [Planctomycetota bacterium]|jgi:AcrR family transcriptional regulator
MTARVRKPKQVRQREIAEAVLRVIGEHGAPALTASRIADEVGVTAGALFRHFESLPAILDAAVELGVEKIEASFPDADLPPTERMRRLAAARIDLLSRDGGLAWLLLSDQVYLTVSAQSVARLRELVSRSRGFLLQAVRDGVADGSLRSDIEPEQLLLIFTGTVHAAIGAAGVHRSNRTQPKVLDSLFTLLS